MRWTQRTAPKERASGKERPSTPVAGVDFYLCERCRTIVETDDPDALPVVKVKELRPFEDDEGLRYFHRWCWSNSPRYRLVD